MLAGLLPYGFARYASKPGPSAIHALPSNAGGDSLEDPGTLQESGVKLFDSAGVAEPLGREPAMELSRAPAPASKGTVLLDAWFNSQKRKNRLGKLEYFHYKWDDQSDTGYSIFGNLLNDYGYKTDTLYEAPTVEKLSSSAVYIIVSPDNPAKNPEPHYVTARDAEQVAQWVRGGGVLLMMENDPANADIDHMNLLAEKFGIHFNAVLSHPVVGDAFPMGRIEVPAGGELFKRPHVLFMKDTCTISARGGARALLVDKGDTLMAAAKYGKGAVFAAADPWLYNEYIDGHRLPAGYDNLDGARELVNWLLGQMQNPKTSENK